MQSAWRVADKERPEWSRVLSDPDDGSAADPGPGLSLLCLSSTSTVKSTDASHKKKLV